MNLAYNMDIETFPHISLYWESIVLQIYDTALWYYVIWGFVAGFYVIWIPISANIPRFIICLRFNTDIVCTVNCSELYDNILLHIASYRKLVFLLTWWVVWALEPSWEHYGVQRKTSLLWHRKRVNGQRFVHFISTPVSCTGL